MNFPVSFISRTAALMGEENCKALCEAMQNDTPVSIRINGAKTGPEQRPDLCQRMRSSSRGQQTDIICLHAPHSRSTRCFMPEAITFRKQRPCFLRALCTSM